MANLSGFDANKVEADVIPVDWYTVVINSSEMKKTNDESGEYLKLEVTIADGKQKGRKVWDNLNLVNKNPVAVQMANNMLASICRAVGVLQPKDSSELHNKPFSAKIGINPAKGEYAASNSIKDCKKLGSSGSKEEKKAAGNGSAAAVNGANGETAKETASPFAG